MMSSKKAVVSIGLVIGALGIAATASALVGAAEDPVVESPTTTVEETTTSEVPTTAEPASTSVPTTSIGEPTTTEVPTTTAAPTPAVPVVAANAFGQCTAFAGRPQPGNSQAWQRLYDTAGGDIESYCAGVIAAHDDDVESEPEADDTVGEPSGKRSAETEHGSGGGAQQSGKGNGSGGGNGKGR